MKKRAMLGTMMIFGPLMLVAATTVSHGQSPVAFPVSSEKTRPRRATAPQSQDLPAPQDPLPRSLPPTTSSTQTVVLPATPPTVSNGTQLVPPATPPPVSSLPVLAPNKIRARIFEAKRLLRTRPMLTSLSASSLANVTIAALDAETSQIHLLTLPKGTFLTRDTEVTLLSPSVGNTFKLRILRSNFVNSAISIFNSAGRALIPLVVEYPIEKNRAFREMAYYTSAHPVLLSPSLVQTGQFYVRSMLDLAAKRLRDKGTAISPRIVDIAEHLCLVEHVDHQRFLAENRLAVFQEVYALYALNETDTYRYSVSTAGAGGMVQMIPATYQMVRRMHPGAGLIPDFVTGMRNHNNALEAMLLYMQDTWNDLASDEEVALALATKMATQAEILAAGYNSNPTRLPNYLQRGGTAWRTLIPRETQMYLQIYRSVESSIPIKPRE